MLCLAAALPGAARAADAPPGFDLIRSGEGVALYRKDYSNGTPDFVQVVDLSRGAAVKPLHGPLREAREGQGVFGGPDARITSLSLGKFWQETAEMFADAFCIANGQFFYMPESPTRLPFSLKVGGEIVSDGYAKNEFPGQKLILELWADRADIRELSQESLYTSSAPDIVAGLSEDAGKRARHYTGRTFVGVNDQNGDGAFETVLIFTTRSARQVDAAEALRSFGADKVMMLDGGGSAQLICGGEALVASERLIPQALAVIAAPPGSPTLTEQPAPQAEAEPPAPVSASIPEAYLPAAPDGPIGSLMDALWVPAIMLPLFLVMFLAISAVRQFQSGG
jgi:hypothetical protein